MSQMATKSGQKVPGDSCQAGFMLELPRSPYQDQNLAPTLKVAWPEDDFLRYFYSSRGIYAAWRIFKRSLERPTATVACADSLLSAGSPDVSRRALWERLPSRPDGREG